MSIETNITEISLDDLDKLFQDGETPLPTADDLSVGEEVETTEEVDKKETPVVENKVEEQTTLEELDDVSDLEELQEQDETQDSDNVSNVLSNTAEFLIKEGLWVDFEGREDLEMTQEVWADLSVKQAQHYATEMFNELIDNTGEYGKAIISYIKQGGDANEIIDIFKEQKSVDNLDVSTDSGKQAKIELYYKDVLKWSEERVGKHLKRIINNDELDEEFETIEDSYKEYYNKKLQDVQREQYSQKQKEIEAQRAFVNSIKDVLEGDDTLSNRERNIIASSILDFRNNVGGRKVNDFYLKFAEIQANPKEYVDLVRYVMDKDTYINKLRQQVKTDVKAETYNFIKGNKSVSKPKAQNISIGDKNSNKKGTDFSFLIKNK